jgi:hypothetical protein
MENISQKTKIIKKNVIVKFEVNTNVISRLYQALVYFSKSYSEQDLEKYKKEAESLADIIKGEKQFSEEWMIHLTTLSILIQQLEAAAEKQNLTEEVSTEDLFKKLENSLKNIIGEDIQSDPQSQEQPE